MRALRAEGIDAVAVAVLLLMSCSGPPPLSARDAADATDTGRTIAASDANERAVLDAVSTLPVGVPRRLGGVNVVADAPYSAASGRTCRALHVAADHERGRDRLACTDGVRWFFVPEVAGAPASE
jgi:hypothetical protein